MRPLLGASGPMQTTGTSSLLEIAQGAARLLVDGNAASFSDAKRKAAANLGYSDLRNLPDNLSVQSALIDYLRLFEGEVYVQRLDAMRRAALKVMRILESFSPRLVGPVLPVLYPSGFFRFSAAELYFGAYFFGGRATGGMIGPGHRDKIGPR